MNHGQWSGYKNKLDVHLRRAADEAENTEVKNYYKTLMKVIQEPAFTGPHYYFIYNMSGERRNDFVAYIREEGDNHYLVVVNYSGNQGCANVPIYNIEGSGDKPVYEALSGVEYIRDADTMRTSGLTVCLSSWQAQIFKYNY